jgi:membrane-anchored glycerophosphoryl diester phosphodiesterase (GDPDase)
MRTKDGALVPGLSRVAEYIQLAMIWCVWFFTQYMILIIMLNFLIAVISDTYSRETERLTMHTYQFRNQLNLEFLTIRDTFFKPKDFHCVLYITDKETYRADNMELDRSPD